MTAGARNLRDHVQATREPGRSITRRRTWLQEFLRFVGFVLIVVMGITHPVWLLAVGLILEWGIRKH